MGLHVPCSKTGMSNPQPAILSHAALQRFYILTFKNSTYIFRFFNSISINECFISLIFYTKYKKDYLYWYKYVQYSPPENLRRVQCNHAGGC